MIYTVAYKNGWIHYSDSNGYLVQTKNFKIYSVKSFRAGQLLVTKLSKGVLK